MGFFGFCTTLTVSFVVLKAIRDRVLLDLRNPQHPSRSDLREARSSATREYESKKKKNPIKQREDIPTIARESLPRVRDTDLPTIRVESCSSSRDPVSGDSVRAVAVAVAVEGDIMQWYSVDS